MASIGHLSGSTDGKAIQVAATSTAGTAVHTAVAATDQIDSIYLYAVNNHTAAVEIEIEFGDATAATNIVVTIPADSGLFTVLNGVALQNSGAVACFAGTTNVVALFGHVLRSSASEAFN